MKTGLPLIVVASWLSMTNRRLATGLGITQTPTLPRNLAVSVFEPRTWNLLNRAFHRRCQSKRFGELFGELVAMERCMQGEASALPADFRSVIPTSWIRARVYDAWHKRKFR